MRVAVSVSIFLLAVTTIGCQQYHKLRATVEFSGNSKYWPNYNLEEATAMIGKRVQVIYSSGQHSVWKTPARVLSSAPRDISLGVNYSRIRVGERGKVIRVLQLEDSPDSYFLIVQWDEPEDGEPMISGFPKKAYDVFLREE